MVGIPRPALSSARGSFSVRSADLAGIRRLFLLLTRASPLCSGLPPHSRGGWIWLLTRLRGYTAVRFTLRSREGITVRYLILIDSFCSDWFVLYVILMAFYVRYLLWSACFISLFFHFNYVGKQAPRSQACTTRLV